MRADDINRIIKNIDQLPYNAILINGAWGIGKSYAINEALAGNSNVCKLSMFGLPDAQKIYHEVLFQLILKNNVGGKIAHKADNILTAASKIWGKLGVAKDVVQSITTERELLLLLSKVLTSVHIIVIDDLERMNNSLNLEEVFGIIEELKQCNYIKVIIVANIAEIPDDNKTIFEKYNEKVIERTYNITEHSQEIQWNKLNIHADFIKQFLTIHKVSNLRTLEKAQRFYDDVALVFNEFQNEDFFNELRWICFAIVVESTENLYYKNIDSNNTDSIQNTLQSFENKLDHRIDKYLYGIKCSKGLTGMLLNYYQQGDLDEEQLRNEYKIFLRSGDKPNYYKTDSEIRAVLPNLRSQMLETNNIATLNEIADSYIIWSDILRENNDDVLAEYKTLLVKLLEDVVKSGKEEILAYSSDLFHMSSEKIINIYNEEAEHIKKYMIDSYIDLLSTTPNSSTAYEYSYKLRNYFDNSNYHNIILERIDKLYVRSSFPIDCVDENKYHTCYNIMYVLYHSDPVKFEQYCHQIEETCDNMSRNRIQNLVKEIIK